MTGDANLALSIIIVNTNTREWLRGCLDSLAKQSVPGNFETVVVDNGSSDGSLEMLEEQYSECRLMALPKTVGFGEANNAGATLCRGEVLLLLNQDTIVGEGALAEFLVLMHQRPRCGIAGGLIYDGDGDLERSTGSYPSLLSLALDALARMVPPLRFLVGRRAHQHWQGYDEARRVDWLTGAYFWIRSDVFHSIGGFDENIYMYADDVDLCYRARRAGWETWFIPNGAIVHYRNKAPVPRDRRQMRRESFHYLAGKHFKRPKFLLTRAAFWLLAKT